MAKQKKAEKETEPKKVKAKAEPKEVELLTGEELVNKVKELGNLSKEEKAKACGYYTTTKSTCRESQHDAISQCLD